MELNAESIETADFSAAQSFIAVRMIPKKSSAVKGKRVPRRYAPLTALPFSGEGSATMNSLGRLKNESHPHDTP
jgi:hypothetical protein